MANEPFEPPNDEKPCPTCSAQMSFTGLPDLMGPTGVKFYRCPNCGIVRVEEEQAPRDGWG